MMKLQRLLLPKLIEWSRKSDRRPLLLQGARQTGKTWLMQELGRQAFQYTAYFDFAQRPELKQIFAATRDPKEIVRSLQLVSDAPIEPGKTLIVFDEIQLCDMAFGSLKYFAQSAPEYAVAACGSLLGVAVRRKNIFVPVGQVEIEHVHPLSFAEYLLNSNPKYYDYLNGLDRVGPILILEQLEREYRRYLCTGGMPDAVSAFLENQSIKTVDRLLEQILALYKLDFSQYTTAAESVRISEVWNAIPQQLAKENPKFFISRVRKDAKSREFTPALQWLADSGLISQVHRVSSPKLPLSAYQESSAFKLYASDVGLLRVLSSLPAAAVLDPTSTFTEFKGALTENFVAISLQRQLNQAPYYWSSGATAEVDFLIQNSVDIYPIEVKSGTSINGKSLSVYQKKFDAPLAVRLSMRNLMLKEKVLNIPLPLADWTLKLIDLARDQNIVA